MYTTAFVVGPPVSGPDFIGRRRLIQAIRASLSAKSSVLLVGERRIGKTSLLRQSRALLASGDHVVQGSHIVFVDLEGLILPSENPGTAVIRAIVKAVRALSDCRVIVPDNIQDKAVEWPELFDVLQQLRNENIQLLFLFDEVDSIILDGPGVIPAMLRSIATAGHLVIATSFRDPTEVNHSSVYGSPWWNVFCIEKVALFEREESRELLGSLSERSGRAFTTREMDFLIEVFGDHPYMLQMAGAMVFNRSEFGICVKAKRRHVLENAVAQTSEQLRYHFSYGIKHLSAGEINALLAIVAGKEVEDVQALGRLADRGIVRSSPRAGFEPFSLTFAMFLKELFERVSEESQARPQGAAWDKISTIASKALETGLGKAIEIAAHRFLA